MEEILNLDQLNMIEHVLIRLLLTIKTILKQVLHLKRKLSKQKNFIQKNYLNLIQKRF